MDIHSAKIARMFDLYNDDKEDNLNKKRQDVIEQIKSYSKEKQFKNIVNPRKYITITVKDECRIVEEVSDIQ